MVARFSDGFSLQNFSLRQKSQRAWYPKYNQLARWRSLFSAQKTHKIASRIGSKKEGEIDR